MDQLLDFMTPAHHAVRNFVVRELPRGGGKPLTPAGIAAELRFDLSRVVRMLDDLEKHLFFVVRNAWGHVSWAFPVTAERTPHRLRFSTGETIYGA